MVGTRDNEKAASALAVPTTRVKLQTFILSGALAGLAGALYVLVLAPVGAGQGTFPAASSIEVFAYAVIGGIGSVAGAVSGVGIFRLLDFLLANQFYGKMWAILHSRLSAAGLPCILYFLSRGFWPLFPSGWGPP